MTHPTRARILAVAASVVGCYIVSAAVTAQRGQPPAARPNVVLVMMDDLGYGDLGSYGVPDAKTPNLDRLAREGVRLTDAYANGPVCSPTRAALISGRYQQRVGIEWALSSVNDKDKSLPVTATSLPALLKANGYATGLVGGQYLLFDLRDDPAERDDFAARRPDLVVSLKAKIAEWEKTVDRRTQ